MRIKIGILVIRFARLKKSTESAFPHQPISTLIEWSLWFGSVDADYFVWQNFCSRQRIADAFRSTGYRLHFGDQLLKCDGCAVHGGMLEETQLFGDSNRFQSPKSAMNCFQPQRGERPSDSQPRWVAGAASFPTIIPGAGTRPAPV